MTAEEEEYLNTILLAATPKWAQDGKGVAGDREIVYSARTNLVWEQTPNFRRFEHAPG